MNSILIVMEQFVFNFCNYLGILFVVTLSELNFKLHSTLFYKLFEELKYTAINAIKKD
jgi:hypothetical protein